MNTIKGMVRIAIVLAIIATVPGFLGGWYTYKDVKTVMVSPAGNKKIPAEKTLTPTEYQQFINKYGVTSRVEYLYPPDWQCAIAGVAGSSIAFLIVFFGISGITRVSLWIAEGFKERK